MGHKQVDPWDEIWAEYDSLHPDQAPLPKLRPHRRIKWRLAGATLLLGGAVVLTAPVQPVLATARLGLEQDPATLLTMLDWPDVLPPAAPPHSLQPGQGAYLRRLSDAIGDGARHPEAMRRVLAARRDLPPQRDPMLLPLDRMWLMQIDGVGRVTVGVADAANAAGFRMDLAWREGSWHVLRVAPLEVG